MTIHLTPNPDPETRIWPDGTYWHQVTITSHWLPQVGTFDTEGTKQTAEGKAAVVAAWLRAVANELDPPVSAARAADALAKVLGFTPAEASGA